MNTQDHAERACATRDNRNITQNGVLRETPTRINVPTGEEPRDEQHAGFVSWAVTKTSIVMPAESKKRGGCEVRTHKCSYCMEQERGSLINAGLASARTTTERERGGHLLT